MENLKTILNACLRVYGADFTVNNRKQNNVYARAAFYHLAKSFTKESLDNIGEVCGARDHSTVINAYKKTVKEKNGAYLLVPEYRKTLAQFEKVVEGIMSIKTESEIENYHGDLISKINSLELENQKLRIELYKKNKENIPSDPIQIRVTKTIMQLPDDVLQEFEKYRLMPFLKLQQSKVLH